MLVQPPVATEHSPCHKDMSKGKQESQVNKARHTIGTYSVVYVTTKHEGLGLNGTPGTVGEGGSVVQTVVLHFVSCY